MVWLKIVMHVFQRMWIKHELLDALFSPVKTHILYLHSVYLLPSSGIARKKITEAKVSYMYRQVFGRDRVRGTLHFRASGIFAKSIY